MKQNKRKENNWTQLSEGRGAEKSASTNTNGKRGAREGEKPQNECEEVGFFFIYNLISFRFSLPFFCTFISKQKESQLRMNVCIIMYEISRRRSAERRLEKVRGRAGVKAAAIHSSSSSSHSSSSSSASSSSSYHLLIFPSRSCGFCILPPKIQKVFTDFGS